MANFKKLKDGEGNVYLVKDEQARSDLSSHTGNTSNPHSVTKAQVGLGNVDNTSDLNKPVSTAQQTALDLKINKSSIKTSTPEIPSNDDVPSIKYLEETFAKINDLLTGTLIPEKSQTAKNLLPVSSASGSTQTAPFINQGTATNNNDSQAEVDTGTLGQHLEKRGNTIVYNQRVTGIVATKTVSGVTFTNNGDGTITISGTADAEIGDNSNGERITYSNMTFPRNNHKVLILVNEKSISGFKIGVQGYNIDTQGKSFIFQQSGSTDWTSYLAVHITNGTTINVTFRPLVIDLTQWYGSNDNIPADLLAHPENFGRYYQGSLAYNTGELVSSNGRYLVNGGQNVLNPDETYNRVIPNRAYNYKGTSTTTITYYDKDKNSLGTESVSNGSQFTTPTNCIYISSSVTSATISLYYEGEDYSTYIPYEAPAVYDTGNEELLAFDTKDPDGTWHKNTSASTDLATFEWTYDSAYYSVNGIHRWYTSVSDVAKLPASNSDVAEIKCDNYVPRSISDMHQNNKLGIGIAQSNGNLYVYNGSGTNSPTGHIQYALKNSTTETGTPFAENMDINDMGNMAWYSAYTDENTNTPVVVPQGCKIFYPAWYAGFIDTLGQREDIDWAADEIVSQEQLEEAFVGYDKTSDLYGVFGSKETAGGILRNLLSVRDSIDFANTMYKDLGECEWTASSTTLFHTSSLNGQIKAQTGAKIICVIYKMVNDTSSLTANTIVVAQSFATSGVTSIVVKTETTYTDATAFKNAMKGILVAVEKASE